MKFVFIPLLAFFQGQPSVDEKFELYSRYFLENLSVGLDYSMLEKKFVSYATKNDTIAQANEKAAVLAAFRATAFESARFATKSAYEELKKTQQFSHSITDAWLLDLLDKHYRRSVSDLKPYYLALVKKQAGL